MARYFVNKNAQANGDHEVHREGCQWMPNPENRIYLGNFTSCGQAVSKAKSMYGKSDGCYHCSSPCHVR